MSIKSEDNKVDSSKNNANDNSNKEKSKLTAGEEKLTKTLTDNTTEPEPGDNKETSEEFIQKSIYSKLDIYLKEHGLTDKKVIDKKTFVDIFVNVTTAEKVEQELVSEAKLFNKVGESFVEKFSDEIPVDKLKDILKVEDITEYFIKLMAGKETK
ncbi:MAG: hypothetical protein MJ252_01070, partial [archaeon]|nr:hypothetical protein [archaeon]